MDGLDEPDFARGEGAPATPNLILDGFSGPLDFLLRLARAHYIDLTVLPLRDMVDQLAQALEQAPAKMPLGQKADWVVMAAWILLLRSNLLLPDETPAQAEAEMQAGELRERLVALQEVQTLARWLDRQPILGRDVFTRGQSASGHKEWASEFGVLHHQPVDVIAFLWACMELFDDETLDTDAVYRPPYLDLHSIPEAHLRILRLLGEEPEPQSLERFLPRPGKAQDAKAQTLVRRRSAWTSTFVASLELAKQGELVLAQGEFLSSIHVSKYRNAVAG
ncbi:MAG TPA: hypothetical protein VMV54_01165 [Acidocella sp.]|nr:hypothetical protein [Acidocella sp.]